MFLRLIDTLSGLIRTIAAIGMIALFLWLVGAVDAGSMAAMGRTHARWTSSAAGAFGGAWAELDWQIVGGVLLLVLLALAVVLGWHHIKRLYLQNRSVNVKVID